MGTSTNGLLWYGVAFEDAEDELGERIELIVNGDPGDEDADLYGDGREWLAEHGLTGVEFVDHCSIDYTMYGLAVAGTLVRAYRGSPKLVDFSTAPDPAPVIAALEALGESAGDHVIGWHLASMWS